MAQLKDLLVSGSSRLIGKLFANEVQLTTLNIPTTSNGTTYGPGTSGQVLVTNGTSTYWKTLATGDIGSGTLPVSRGGTGNTVATQGGVVYGNGTTYALTAAGSSGQVLISNGTSAPSWRSVLNNTSAGALGWNSAGASNADNLRLVNVNTIAYWNGAYSGTSSNLKILGTVTTGTWNATTIGVAYGGTGKTSWAAGNIIYASAATTLAGVAVGTSGQLLQSGGTGAPSWISPSSITAGQASKITNLTSSDAASSTDTWRYVWFSYNDNATGRPAYSSSLAYQSSTGTLKATKFQGDGSLLTNLDLSGAFQTLTNSFNTLTIKIGGTEKTCSVITSVSNSWTAGTTAGPSLVTTVNGSASTGAAIPSASATASGVVTTGAQQFVGRKTFGYMTRKAVNDSNEAVQWVGDTYLVNGAGTAVGEYWYNCGNATNITTGQYSWRQYSPNSTANTSTTGKYETYSLPAVATGLTENKSYSILTTKSVISVAQGGTGSSTAAGARTNLGLGDLATINKPSSNQTTTFLRGDGTWQAANNYSLPLAANGTRGGVQIGYTTSGKNYAVQLSSEKMYVNVPWENTTYSAGTGLSLSGTTFNHSNSVTAKTAAAQSAKTLTWGGTFTIYEEKYDAQGHITGVASYNMTMPANPNTDTDTKVTQSASTTANWRKILLHYKDDAASTTAVTTSTNQVYAAVGISAQASTGTIRANSYKVTDSGTITYNTSNGCVEIIC